MKWRLDAGQIEVIDDCMVPILREKTPAERIAMVGASYRTARLLVAAGVRHYHPDWSDDRVEAEVIRRITRGAA